MNQLDVLEVSEAAKNCIFCKILRGEEEATFLYRDEKVSAFLDIHPLFEGHTLVIPNTHFSNIEDVPPDVLSEVAKVAKVVGIRMLKNFDAEGINVMHSTGRVAGQTIFHFHLHVLPRKAGDDSKFHEWWFSRSHKATREELDDLAKKISDD